MASTTNGGKRIMDLVLGGAMLVVSLPAQAAVALLVRLSSPGPVLHRATRAGLDGRPFILYKFRTMVAGADLAGPGITAADDPRITRVGRWIRRTHLDELPQLFNVVRGDMSLVGPRPEDPHFVALYAGKHREVLGVRPGITGPTQLAFRHEDRLLPSDDVETAYVRDLLPQKLAMDLQYVHGHALLTDLWILLRTIRAVFP